MNECWMLSNGWDDGHLEAAECARLRGDARCPVHSHEYHDERYVTGCPDCDEEIGMEMQAYRPHPNSMSYPEAEEGLAMRRRLPENQ